MSIRSVALVAGPAGLDYLLDPLSAHIEASGASVVRAASPADYMGVDGQGADVDIIVTPLGCSREAIAAGPKLRGVLSPFIGVDGIDIAAASEMGVLVANTHADANVDSVAESGVMLILASLYDLHGTEAVLRHDKPRPQIRAARMLSGKTVGLVGFGRIAQAIAKRLQTWDVKVQASTRRPVAHPPFGVTMTSIETVLETSDVVVVLVALAPETHHLMNAQRLASMKPDVVFLNLARGPVVDERALIALMQARPQMRGALDVFEVEPLPADSPLRDLPNLILTPHMISHTREAAVAIPKLAADQALAVLRGEAPQCLLNHDALPSWRARWGAER